MFERPVLHRNNCITLYEMETFIPNPSTNELSDDGTLCNGFMCIQYSQGCVGLVSCVSKKKNRGEKEYGKKVK